MILHTTIVNLFLLFIAVAQFRYTQLTYVVGESNGPAVPAIELVFGTLMFDIDVDVATVPGGSAAGTACTTILISIIVVHETLTLQLV